MRNTLAFVGLGFVIIAIGAWYAFGHTQPSPSSDDILSVTPIASDMKLSSNAFEQGSSVPSQFTCDGANTSPPLSISDVPVAAKSLALLMDDPDVPKQLKPDGVFDHWVMFNMPPETSEIAANSSVGVAGANGAGKSSYTGPCPPAQYEPSEHRYFFRLFALDVILQLPAGATKQQVLDAMQGHIIAQTELIGKYKRK